MGFYTVKKVSDFHLGMSLTKISLAGSNLIISDRENLVSDILVENNLITHGQGEFWLVTSWLGTGKLLTFFYSVSKTYMY